MFKIIQKEKLLPIIDINKKYQGETMIKACLNHGFFYIDNRQGQVIDLSTVEELERKGKEFFGLSEERKRKYSIENSKSLTGYAGFQSMTGYVGHSNETLFFHSEGLFPSDQKEEESIRHHFEPELSKYIELGWKLNQKIYEHLAPYLDSRNVKTSHGFLKNWKEGFREQLWVSRFLHYPPNGGIIAPHNDVGLLNILNQDQTGGLQVWFREEWIDVDPIPNTFVVNIGDILQSWSSGLLKSTRHRVCNKKPVDRYSMTFLPLFDKNCEIYIQEKNEWKYPYLHLAERYYAIFKHLADKVQNPLHCLEGKTPYEIDKFHQQILNV